MNYTTAKLVLSCLFNIKTLLTSLHFTLLHFSLVNFPPEETFGQFDLSISYHYIIQTATCSTALTHPRLHKSKSKLYYDRQSVGQSVLVSGTHLAPATNFSPVFLIIFRQLRVCWSGAHSLTRGRVCNLQCNDESSISSYIATIRMAAWEASNGHLPNITHVEGL
jgi:hypothetical protein